MNRYSAVLLLVLSTVTIRAQYTWQMQFPSLPVFANPVEIVHANDGTNRMFVVQLRGIIYVFENTPSVSVRKVFLNLSDRVSQSGSETGLLGLAFHPSYPDSPYCYVNYTRTTDSLRSYIARYTVSASNPDSAVRESENILLTFTQPFSNHNGGSLNFGSDGFLYIASGDGGSGNDPGNRAQNRTTLLGKILRIDVDRFDGGLKYSIPVSNPYYNNTSGFRPEIYAYGLRNPWKMSFDPLTGTLWAGDVGQDAREEIDTIVSGGNYGWRLMEGNICTPAVNSACNDTAGLIRPVFDYPNLNPPNEGSITGGYVYRGSAIPSLYGKYIYGDYISGRTFVLTFNGTSPPVNTQLSDETYGISSFGVDTAGNIYLSSYGANGRIYKLTGPATAVEPENVSAPKLFSLEQNFPNPFNPATTVTFSLERSALASLEIFDLLGNRVAHPVHERKEPGKYSVSVDLSTSPSGIYFYRLSVNGYSVGKKMVLLK